MSDATIALGCKLKRGDGNTVPGPETFTAIGEVFDINGPEVDADDVEVTNFDSPDNFREFKRGLKTGGEVAFEANFVADDPTQDQLWDDQDAGTISNWQIDMADATEELDVSSLFGFKAYVKSLAPKAVVNDRITLSGTLKITGKVTPTPRHATIP